MGRGRVEEGGEGGGGNEPKERVGRGKVAYLYLHMIHCCSL